jgi:hypothetical protein
MRDYVVSTQLSQSCEVQVCAVPFWEQVSDRIAHYHSFEQAFLVSSALPLLPSGLGSSLRRWLHWRMRTSPSIVSQAC